MAWNDNKNQNPWGGNNQTPPELEEVIKDFKNKLDPRMYNGAILLGLNGPVIKSHGSTDATGIAHSIKMCNKIVKGNLIEKIKKNLAN